MIDQRDLPRRRFVPRQNGIAGPIHAGAAHVVELRFFVQCDNLRVTSVDWASYPILRMNEAPAVEVALINHPELPLLGAGEAASAPVAGALANAVFDATGARMRVAPFTPQRVKAPMSREPSPGGQQ